MKAMLFEMSRSRFNSMPVILSKFHLSGRQDKLTAETQRIAEGAQRLECPSTLCAISATSLGSLR